MVESGQPLVIEDIQSRPEFAEATNATRFDIRAYAGVPLMLQSGETVGTLFAVDRSPHLWSQRELAHLGDVAKLVMAEIEVRRKDGDVSDDYFRSLIENSHDLITVIDPTGVITYESAALEQMLGYTPEELIGRNVFDYIHPDDLTRVQTELAELLAVARSTRRAELRFRHKNGEWRVLDVIGNNLTADVVAGIVVHSRDVTDSRKMEDRLRELSSLEAVGRVAGGMAHDFNNILTGIGGTAELLAADLAQNPDALSDLAGIRNGVSRAAGLVRQLLAFSQRQTLQPRAVDVNAVIHSMRSSLQELCGPRISLVEDLSPGTGECLADPEQLQKIIFHLVENARDAMPDGGVITLRTRVLDTARNNVTKGMKFDGDRCLHLSVSDTGTGIPSHVLPHIFEPYYTTKARSSASGLGLSGVLGTVQQSGGVVTVDTVVGKGTTVNVFLPHASASKKAEPSIADVRGTGRILVVDDEAAVRGVVVRSLQNLGYSVVAAGSGEEALKLFEQDRKFDLILTDVVMPGLDGRELAEKIGDLRPGMRILFMSGFNPQTASNDIEYVAKPFTVATLASAVKNALLPQKQVASRGNE